MAALILTDFPQFTILAAWPGAGAISAGVVWPIRAVYDMASPLPRFPIFPLARLLFFEFQKFFFFQGGSQERMAGD